MASRSRSAPRTASRVRNEPGEIYVRSPNACVGFFDDPERTSATFLPDGWIRSGDIGVLDDDGYLTIVGRKKEIIIRGGLNIAPREIEELILDFPQVAATAVVGLPHDRLGEIVCACVVLREVHADIRRARRSAPRRERSRHSSCRRHSPVSTRSR